MNFMNAWISRVLKDTYFPEIWYFIENWLTSANGKKVLEIGSGRGLFTKALALSDWQIDSVDPSVDSLKRTSLFLEGSLDKVNLIQAEPEKLPFASASYDMVVSVHMMEFTRNPLAYCGEIYRVLKPGGKAVVVVSNRSSFWAFRSVVGLLRKDVAPRPFYRISRSQLKGILRASGFTVYNVKLKARYLPLQFNNVVIPFPIGGVFAAAIEKTDPQQPPKPNRFRGIFHKS
jgi:ubiquinone/menaquinone biosynthesis C-methylase UbiE